MRNTTNGQQTQVFNIAFLLMAAMLFLFSSMAHAQGQSASNVANANVASNDLAERAYRLEDRKVTVEEKRLADAQATINWTPVSIIVPILAGAFALWYQARTQYKVKKIESSVAFQLKAAEIILSSKGTKAGEERARALRDLFPEHITEEFVKVFKRENFKLPGTAYQEKKLELFKSLAVDPARRWEIFRLFGMLYADEETVHDEFADKWKNAYPEDAQLIDDFINKWRQSYPKGKWVKPPAEANAEAQRRAAGEPSATAR